MKYQIIALVFGFTIVTASAQEMDSKTRLLSIGAGTSYVTVRDFAASPLRFGGLGVYGQLGYEWNNKIKFQNIRLNFQTSGLNNSTSYRSDTRAYGGKISYSYLRRIGSAKQLGFRLGGIVDIWGNARVKQQRKNNPVSYDAGASLTLATHFSKHVSVSKSILQLDYSLAVPVLTYLIRPAYGVPYPKNYLEDGVYNPKDEGIAGPFLKSGSLVTFNDFFRVQSNVTITYPIKSRNALRLGYGWDFYSIQSLKKVQLADHTVSLSLLINL